MKEAIDAYDEKEKRKWLRDAWFTAWILMCLSGKEVDPSLLLPEWISPKKTLTKEEKDKELKELKDKLKVED